MKNLGKYLKRNIWYIIIGPFFKLLEAISELLNPILVAKIIDNVVNGPDTYYIVKIGLTIIAVNIIAIIFSILGQKCSAIASTRVGTDMRTDLFEKISSFSHAELDKFGTATLINRIINDTAQVEAAVGMFMRNILRVPLLLIGAFVISLIKNPKMSFVFLALIPIVSVILYFFMKKTSPYSKKIRTKLDNISRVTKENLDGTRVIRAFNKQEAEIERFTEVADDYTVTNIKVTKISSMLEPLIFLIVDLAVAGLLAIGGWQVNIGGMSQGDVIALIDYVGMITTSLLLMSHIIVTFVRTIASLHRIDEINNTIPAVQDAGNAKYYRKLKYENLMEFENVSFNYSGNKDEKSFIKDLSFVIKPGQTIGIIGGTGSGKTTIASLMTRFYDATQGRVLYKGKDIKEFSLKQIRKEISIVQQRSLLFSGSLRQNMQIRDLKAKDEEIINALKISQAWSFVDEWPQKLDYQIMAGGKNVSGGQMQRLTIARALIGNPEMIILDDSSSALDFLTDSNLRHDLKTLNSTLVFISQRATSIKAADLIIVLDNGDVVGMGKHADLMKNCEIYKEPDGRRPASGTD
ncbi:MAG: ABC transporter ATP-binding protein/permease, partial [Clostridia bacterium]|nr:ABC transporter ATP-binding protein/permease [Clostridia bacterium]